MKSTRTITVTTLFFPSGFMSPIRFADIQNLSSAVKANQGYIRLKTKIADTEIEVGNGKCGLLRESI